MEEGEGVTKANYIGMLVANLTEWRPYCMFNFWPSFFKSPQWCICVCAWHYEPPMQPYLTVCAIFIITYWCSYLDLIFPDSLSTPNIMVGRVTNSAVEYQIQRNDGNTRDPLITGYEVIRFGVPMIGEYENTGIGRRATISPVVPGAQYRITAWALGDVTRSATSVVMDVTTGVASKTMLVVEFSSWVDPASISFHIARK